MTIIPGLKKLTFESNKLVLTFDNGNSLIVKEANGFIFANMSDGKSLHEVNIFRYIPTVKSFVYSKSNLLLRFGIIQFDLIPYNNKLAICNWMVKNED